MFARIGILAAAAAWVVGSAGATTLRVDATAARGSGGLDLAIESTVKRFTRNVAIATRQERLVMTRAGRHIDTLTFPVRVSVEGAAPRTRQRGTTQEITLRFETSGPRAFPPEYQSLLQSVFSTAQSRLNLVFGLPNETGEVWVRNYDADIGDRDAVAGGVYLDNNGSGEREILFPVYADSLGIKAEVAAVNFIHTLLLAYEGASTVPFDGWSEGLVRAATMRVVRTPGSLPNALDPSAVADIVASTYDIGPNYDWNNQRALSAPRFIAPNLRDTPLPVGGSVGGLYLVRYLMAGSAWQKVLTEHPGFPSRFRTAYANNPTTSFSGLQLLGDNVLSQLGASVIEGRDFASWAREQFILNPQLTPGRKLQIQPFPVLDGLAGSDFGVFAIQAHAFETLANGNEILSRDRAYPIYWSPDFTRFFASAQDDRIEIVQGYGSVVPNFVNSFNGEPYRVTVDVPLGDQLERVALPSGAVARPGQAVSNVWGTISGIAPAINQTLSVEVQYGSTTQTLPVRNFAFGGVISDTAFEGSLPLTVRVLRTIGGTTTPVFTRRVNKGPGAIGLELEVDARTSVPLPIEAGVRMIGLPIGPLEPAILDAIGGGQVARWDPQLNRFVFGSAVGNAREGMGIFLRSPAPRAFTLRGFQPINQPISVPLQQGWNMICNPLDRPIGRADIQFITETGFPQTFNEAVGTTVGPDIFRYVPASSDPITGIPESGFYSSVSGLGNNEPFFIKVLSPTGATAVFGRTSTGNRSATVPPPPRKWSFRVGLESAEGRTEAVFGQRDGATATFDRGFDTELPPGASGMGMTVGNGLYRDTRGFGNAMSIPIQLSRLRLGRTYTLSLEPESSLVQRYRFRDPARRFTRDWSGTRSYTFVANSTTRTMSVETERPR